MKRLIKLALAGAIAVSLNSCVNVEGYDATEMGKALKSMRVMQYNTRVFTATGGRYNPHFR